MLTQIACPECGFFCSFDDEIMEPPPRKCPRCEKHFSVRVEESHSFKAGKWPCPKRLYTGPEGEQQNAALL